MLLEQKTEVATLFRCMHSKAFVQQTKEERREMEGEKDTRQREIACIIKQIFEKIIIESI